MSLIGSIECFDPSKGDIESYIDRMEQLFEVNVITEKKVPLLITFMGAQTYEIVKNLVLPNKPKELSYEQLVKVLKDHFAPKKNIIAERFKFYKRDQKSEESIADYLVELKKLSATCEFGNFLNEALRDRFVCGLKNEATQRKLLSETTQQFADVCRVAIAMELAIEECKSLQPESVSKIGEKNRKYKADMSRSVSHKVMSQSKSQPKSQQKSDSNSGTASQVKSKCHRCGRWHNPETCPANNWLCYTCNRKGHTSRMCSSRRIHGVEEEEVESPEEEEDEYQLGNLNIIGKIDESLIVTVLVQNKKLVMEVDTGAARTVMSECNFKQLFKCLKLSKPQFKLKVVTGQQVRVIGQVQVEVNFNDKLYILPIVVIESLAKFVPLIGRNWLDVLCPNWRNTLLWEHVTSKEGRIGSLETEAASLEKELKNEFPSVFKKELSTSIKVFEADIQLKENVVPIFHKAYSMPFALKKEVEKELLSMVESGILIRIKHSEWASPIVIVPKKNNEIRICVDFKATVNQVIKTEHYPLPVISDILSSLSGGMVYCVLDLAGAYQQLKVSEASQPLLTINTHMGLFRFTRLTYGISSAPGCFQSVMDRVLVNMEDAFAYLDDIIIKGKDIKSCYKNVREVLKRLDEYNIKVNVSKCKFFQNSVEYLGHLIDGNGIHPTQDKVRAIVEAPEPKDLTQLKAYLGLLNFYSRFMPMLSSKLRALYKLQTKDEDFFWTKECSEAFSLSKSLLLNNQLLVHFDTSKPIIVSCDASQYGVGAVLSHLIDGQERPIQFASSSLSKAERGYAQIEREALAIIFAVKRFHKFLYGRKFTLVSDHQPLKIILSPKKGIPTLSAARIQRWAIILSAYNYDIVYRKGSELGNADALSRLPLNVKTEVDQNISSFNNVEEIPISAIEVAEATKRDKLLCKVLDLTKRGWPQYVTDQSFKPYFTIRHELSLENECLLWGNRVIIPTALRSEILKLMHEQHLGIVRTKMLARSVCWWPNMNSDIENMIENCEVCQKSRNLPKDACLVAWPTAIRNGYRIHVDFFYKNGTTFLIIVDSKSKWIDVYTMSNTTAISTINKLKQSFAIFGLPVEIVSDNGPPFSSSEFVKFCQCNSIKPIKSPPYHPQSNGLAERGVQTVKKALDRQLFGEGLSGNSKLTIEQRLQNFLFTYRNTPCTVTGIAPAECMFKIKPRTRLDVLKPGMINVRESVKAHEDGTIKRVKLFSVGDKVLIRNRQGIGNTNWVTGNVVKIISSVTYLVSVGEQVRFVHAGDMKLAQKLINVHPGNPIVTIPLPSTSAGIEPKGNSVENTKNGTGMAEPDSREVNVTKEILPIEQNIVPPVPEERCNTGGSTNSKTTSDIGPPLRRSSRKIKPPQRLNL